MLTQLCKTFAEWNLFQEVDRFAVTSENWRSRDHPPRTAKKPSRGLRRPDRRKKQSNRGALPWQRGERRL